MKNIISLANEFIVKNHVHSVPLRFDSLKKLCHNLDYKLLPIGENKELISALKIGDVSSYIAFTYLHDDIKLVFFDETVSTGTRHFAIAHEIGHIALKHNYCGAIAYSKATGTQEREADTFAYQLLAPLCVLKVLGITRVRDIEQYTLLDKKRALHIKAKLMFYNFDSADDKVLHLHGTRRPLRKVNIVPYIATALASAILGAAITLHFIRADAPSEETAATTEDVLKILRDRTSTVQTTTGTPLPPEELTETVYITPHGAKYHKESCYHLKNSSSHSAVSAADATADGFTPCKSCFK